MPDVQLLNNILQFTIFYYDIIYSKWMHNMIFS